MIDELKRVPHVVATGSDARVWRTALRSQGIVFEEVNDASDNAEPELSLEDKYKGKFVGKSLVFVGGDRMEEAVRRISDYFGFETIDWIHGDHPAELNAYTRRAEEGKLDIVMCLVKLCGHGPDAQMRRACAVGGVPYVMVRGGYGINNLMRAMDEAMIHKGTAV